MTDLKSRCHVGEKRLPFLRYGLTWIGSVCPSCHETHGGIVFLSRAECNFQAPRWTLKGLRCPLDLRCILRRTVVSWPGTTGRAPPRPTPRPAPHPVPWRRRGAVCVAAAGASAHCVRLWQRTHHSPSDPCLRKNGIICLLLNPKAS